MGAKGSTYVLLFQFLGECLKFQKHLWWANQSGSLKKGKKKLGVQLPINSQKQKIGFPPSYESVLGQANRAGS
jgi:hypothetical protein